MPNGIFSLKQQVLAIREGGWPGQKPLAVDYLVVAGGGGGGTDNGGGGGGGGGLLQGNLPVATGSAITVTVGGGGAASTIGGNSVFSSISATGGGRGGGSTNALPAGSGGSGGGSNRATVAGSGVSGQGNAGGLSQNSGVYSTGGGGGAGTVGFDGSSGATGIGGAGVASDISGTRTTYAGGGGGAVTSGVGSTLSGGAGGAGGGGAGATSGAGTAGTANTGGGGGGGANAAGGAGGSGIVILSYPDIYAAAASTTGSPTVSTSGSGSVYLNGSSYWTVPDNASLDMGSSNFTIEGWYYPTGNASSATAIFSKRADNITVGGVLVYFASTGLTPSLLVDTGGSWGINTASSVAFNSGQWNHFAVVRNGNNFNLYINGVSGVSATSSATIPDNSSAFAVGAMGANGVSPSTACYISNFRVVKGTAVYTGAFTPPTAPLTAITNTSLLFNTVSGAYLADGSTNSLTASVGGAPAWNSASPFATGLGYKNRVYTWTSSGSITF